MSLKSFTLLLAEVCQVDCIEVSILDQSLELVVLCFKSTDLSHDIIEILIEICRSILRQPHTFPHL